MKKIEDIERLAQHNQKLADHESQLAKKEKILSNKLKSRIKARRSLIKKEMEIANIRKALAEKNQELVNKRLEISQEDIMDFPENLLNHEKEYALFNEKLAENLIELTNLYLEVIEIEALIATSREKLANNNLKMAKIRSVLAQQQYKYARTLKLQPDNEKVIKMEMDYLSKQKDLKKVYSHVEKDVKDLIEKKNKLAELSKKISLNLAVREKLRLHEN
ncbi:MAG: hypothetical protein ACFFBH_13125 [Promethearchaeota archaeon]